MLFSEWYNKQCIHKNWQAYTQINRGTICAKELPFRVQPSRGVNCGLIPDNEDIHESLDEFKILPDTTTNPRVICPCISEKLM